MIKQTAGRDSLGEFAPNFAHYNDDILFGENWNDESIDLKTRCIITVVALMSSGITDNSLRYHLENAKKNIRIDYINHIANTFNVPVKDLFVERKSLSNQKRKRSCYKKV